MSRSMPVLLALWAIAVFLPALGNDFVNWDDQKNFLTNPYYRGLGWTELHWMFTSFLTGQYVPLSWMTLGLDYVVWGMNPLGYHLTNVLLHAVNTVLLYLLARRVLRLTTADHRDRGTGVGPVIGAACAALVFAVHPLRVESVAWITERRDVLSGAFYLLTILAYLRHVEAASGERDRRRPWYWLTLFTFVLALMAKSMSVTVPAVLLILDVYPLGRLPSSPRRWLEASFRPVWIEKIPFFLLSAADSVLAVKAGLHGDTLNPIGFVDRVAVSLYALAFYLWKTAVPLGLAPLYEMPESIDAGAWYFLLSGTVVVGMTAAAIAVRRRWPALSAVWLAYVVILLPVLGLVHNGVQIAADRYTYLACIGWAILAGAVVATSWQGRSTRFAVSVLCLAMAAVTGLSILTVRQVKVWRNSETLWTWAVAAQPSSIAHFHLGLVLADQGRFPEAAKHWQQALQIRPRYGRVHVAFAKLRDRENKPTEALEHYREAVRLTPDDALAQCSLGIMLWRLGRPAEAAVHAVRALEIAPGLLPCVEVLRAYRAS